MSKCIYILIVFTLWSYILSPITSSKTIYINHMTVVLTSCHILVSYYPISPHIHPPAILNSYPAGSFWLILWSYYRKYNDGPITDTMNRVARSSRHILYSRSPSLLSPIHGPSRVPRRFLGIPSAFLLDDYLPKYQLLTSVESAKKRSHAYAHLRECNLCPRRCGVNRYETTGMCLIGAQTAKVNVIAPHRGEEPCIQGFHGSGSVFFSGCNLRCVFCQNHV